MASVTINFPEPLERFYYFAEDQVLTAGQLNQLAGHFDREHRLTRTKAVGIGIICGLDVQLSGGEIRLSKGAAITSSGDLLQVPEGRIFTHFRQLQDENSVSAEDGSFRVLKLGSEATPIPMWRLHTEAADDGSRLPLSGLTGNASPENLALVLFLDSYLKEPEACTDTNCDNGGVTQMNELMAVLVPKQHLVPAENSPNRRRRLPKATVKNVNLAGGTITNVQNLIDRYEAALTGSVPSLTEALAQIPQRFPGLVQAAFGEANPSEKWTSQVRSLASQQNNTPRIQYTYDFFQDLADAVNELWDAITDIPGECCPSADLFPKYVMAGELVRPAGLRFPDYRHYFNESPVLNGGDSRAARAVFLLRRIGLMVRGFSAVQPSGDVRISPSRKAGARLGDRAVPFYYGLTDETPLHEFWSFEKSQLGMENTNHGYRMREISDLDDVKNPFDYTTNASDFYRVEGMLGMNIEEAEKRLDALQKQHNLGFKIETIQIEDDLPKVKPFRPVKFPDLNLFFRHYRDDLHSNLHLADHYVGNLKTAFDNSDKAGFQNAKDPDGSDVLTNLTTAVETERVSFTSKISAVTTRMYKPLREFHADFSGFRQDYDDAATIGDSIDRKVTYSKQAVVGSPVQKLVLENSFKRFDTLVDIFKKRTDFVLRQYIFDKFFNQNPGLRHQCGVPDGGTLVLAYSSVSQQVVADFALSYCCVVEAQDDDDNTPPPPVTVKPLPGIIVKPPIQPGKLFWLDKLDLVATPRIPKDVLNFGGLTTRMSILEKDVETKFSIIPKTIEDQVNSKTVTLFGNYFTGGKTASGGLTAPGGLEVVPGGFRGEIVDSGLKRDTDFLKNTAERLAIFEDVPEPERTPEMNTEIAGLRKQVADQSSKLIEKAGATQGDIAAGTDAHAVLGVVANVVETTKATVDFTATSSVVDAQLDKSVTESNFSKADTFNKLKFNFRLR
ncbi:MAG: hypothetical protein HY842_13935 [Bacteroidetes bacterium]|nr:hypothetical protein [Bacteroidota bacterium]